MLLVNSREESLWVVARWDNWDIIHETVVDDDILRQILYHHDPDKKQGVEKMPLYDFIDKVVDYGRENFKKFPEKEYIIEIIQKI